MSYDHLPYRPCVGIALFNAENKVFVGQRIDNPDNWQFPQGGIDEGEDVIQAALRELGEEVGSSKAEVIRQLDEWLQYDIPTEILDRLPWGNKHRGQKQKWIAMRFTGEDSDINLEAHDPAEFCDWQWMDLPDVLQLVVPFKRDIYVRLIEEFSDIAS